MYLSNTAEFTPTLEMSTYLPFVALPLPEELSPDLSGPHSAVCNEACSNTRACPDCSTLIHVVWGHAVDTCKHAVGVWISGVLQFLLTTNKAVGEKRSILSLSGITLS